MEGVINVTFHIWDPDVMRFRHHAFLVISIFHLVIKPQMFNRGRAVKCLTVLK
jgi:hypothetical protein